jgi:hypothetical protein
MDGRAGARGLGFRLQPGDQRRAGIGERGVDLHQRRARVATPAEANFVLNTGPDDLRDPTSLDGFEAELRDCLGHRLPMVCANPDLEVIRGGRLILCAGALALRYQALGGDMRILGRCWSLRAWARGASRRRACRAP